MDGIATKERHDAFRGAGPGQTCRRATIAQTRGRHGVTALVEAVQHARAEGVARSNGTRDVSLGEVERPDGGRRRARSLRTFAGAPPGLKHMLLMLASMPRRGEAVDLLDAVDDPVPGGGDSVSIHGVQAPASLTRRTDGATSSSIAEAPHALVFKVIVVRVVVCRRHLADDRIVRLRPEGMENARVSVTRAPEPSTRRSPAGMSPFSVDLSLTPLRDGITTRRPSGR